MYQSSSAILSKKKMYVLNIQYYIEFVWFQCISSASQRIEEKSSSSSFFALCIQQVSTCALIPNRITICHRFA